MTTHHQTSSRAVLIVTVAAGLVGCLPSGMTCGEREATVADVLEEGDFYASPQVALAAFLDSHARFREWSLREIEVRSDTASWSFFDDAESTVAEAKAARTDAGWAMVKWEYCRG